MVIDVLQSDCDYVFHCKSKNQDTRLLSVTLPDVDWFYDDYCKFPAESVSGGIFKIGQHLAKLWT